MSLVFFSNPEGLVVPRPSSPLSCSLRLPHHINLQTTVVTGHCKEAADFLFLFSTLNAHQVNWGFNGQMDLIDKLACLL